MQRRGVVEARMKADLVAAKEFWDRFRSADDPEPLMRAEMEALAPARRKAIGEGITLIADREIRKCKARKETLEREYARLTETTAAMDEAAKWLDLPIRLERPPGSCAHHLRQALADKQAFIVSGKMDVVFGRLHEFEEAIGGAQCFVVEHDWAKAFEGAGDFESGDIRLPFDVCAFEFKITGRRVTALMTTIDDAVFMQAMVRGPEFWLIDQNVCRHENGGWVSVNPGHVQGMNPFQELVEFIGAQVRAITIALDAQVAESEVVRVNEKLARSREKSGAVPPKPYHVVSLARRSRAAPLAPSGEPEHGKVRLHFRRGHWRHYEDHKTWIRWMLVGNPDLGFVDKEYRL